VANNICHIKEGPNISHNGMTNTSKTDLKFSLWKMSESVMFILLASAPSLPPISRQWQFSCQHCSHAGPRMFLLLFAKLLRTIINRTMIWLLPGNQTIRVSFPEGVKHICLVRGVQTGSGVHADSSPMFTTG